MNSSPEITVAHDESRKRFEMRTDAGSAFVSYTQEGDIATFDHTYVPESLRGKGVAAALARAALTEARRRHWKVIPRCSYIAAFIGRNPEFADLVAQ